MMDSSMRLSSPAGAGDDFVNATTVVLLVIGAPWMFAIK
jgi:hypothetical protein